VRGRRAVKRSGSWRMVTKGSQTRLPPVQGRIREIRYDTSGHVIGVEADAWFDSVCPTAR